MSLTDRCEASESAPSLAKRLARAERLLRLNELMVAALIHDLRTPLMVINLSAEIALARTQDHGIQQAARRIRESSERMSRMFEHLLNFSRVGAAVPDLDLQPGDLRQAVEAVLDEFRSADPRTRFEVTREGGDLTGVFDTALLRRSIANLIATSLEHAGENRTVDVHLNGSHRDRLLVRVSVPGVIPAELQERMFVPGPSRPGLEIPGLGLGLDAIDGFVRAHGGSVVGHSQAPGGTVFELLLPRDAMASLAAHEDAPAAGA